MSAYFNIAKKLASGIGQAINKVKTNVPKTKIQKGIRDLKIANEKLKGSAAKLKQTQFELKNNQPITFKGSNKKSESNKEAYKRIQKDNAKVIGRMFKKATENKKDGGRMGLKKGGGSDLGMQSVIHGVDNNKNITAADPKAKFIAKAKNKKSKKKII